LPLRFDAFACACCAAALVLAIAFSAATLVALLP
jgi:hypothetical protein